MLQKLKDYIESTGIIKPNDRLLLAVSGGIDSMVMLNLFQSLPYYFEVAHMNFGLRADESDADQLFVEEYCLSRNIILHTQKVDTSAYVEQEKVSIQMAARSLRYFWFEELKTKHKLNKLATAHHSEDSIETIFINLIRGTGISGLKGIVSNEIAVRPFLCFNRDDIRTFALDQNIKWREDSSNLKEDYLRNKLRHSILPMFDDLNKQWKSSVLQLGNVIESTEVILEEYYENHLHEFFDGNKIDILALKNLSNAKWMFQRLLSTFNFTYHTSLDIYHHLNIPKGKFYESTTHRLVKQDGYFDILSGKEEHLEEYYRINGDTPSITFEDNKVYSIQKIDKSSFNSTYEKGQAYLDYGKLSFPLIVRRWKQGDWFIPLGMKGKKKLSDYFVDEKFTIKEKENTFVIVSAEDIVCILGHRTDDRYKIKNDTEVIYTIKQTNG